MFSLHKDVNLTVLIQPIIKFAKRSRFLIRIKNSLPESLGNDDQFAGRIDIGDGVVTGVSVEIEAVGVDRIEIERRIGSIETSDPGMVVAGRAYSPGPWPRPAHGP